MEIPLRRGRRKEEIAIPLRREGRKEEMIPVDNEMVVTTLPFPVVIPVDNDLITMLPFPMLIPVDDNDLKSLALSVDVVSKTLVALESAFLTGGFF